MSANINNDIYDCKDYEKMIPAYLANSLPPYEMERLLGHIKKCSSCKEELTIQYLVSDGLWMVENSDNYDLLRGLAKKINDSERYVKRYRLKYRIMACLSIIILLAVLISIILLIFF